EFVMGSGDAQARFIEDNVGTPSWYHIAVERPSNFLTLPPYAIGRYPVTVGEFRMFVEDFGYEKRRFWSATGWKWREDLAIREPFKWRTSRWTGDDNLPVIGVSWYEAVAYCAWLSDLTGWHYQLPTEAQWEKAARGPEGMIFPWGNAYESERANVDDGRRSSRVGRFKRTTPVGSFPEGASFFGAEDMSGNVWEWCLSAWAEAYVFPENNNTDGDVERIIRGGAWNYPPRVARTAFRLHTYPHERNSHTGFRVCHTFEDEA
ncbi:MAG: formylglycine-generating enzyme family protein, partial [Anaerolineae bacterium]